MSEQTVTMRYRMSNRDVFYGGGVVNGARSITYMGDVADRLMAKVYGNVGRCSKVKKIRLYVPCFAGDYMEFIARLKCEEGKKAIIEVRSFKIAVIPEKPEFESSIDVLEDPPISTEAVFEYEIPEKKNSFDGGENQIETKTEPIKKTGNKALAGLKVLDLTHAYNGPFCSTLLADNGADVIKIEPVDGDQCRTWGPMDEKSGESGFFAFLNRNKKGCTLNLKNEKALNIFYELVKEADVVVENYRVGVTKKLKVDYETLKKINPSIIYASGSGFGQYGPLSNRPCYDIVAQSMGGMVNLTGYPDAPPVKVGPSIGDNVTGIYLCTGLLMALYHREKTGEGQQVDVSMADTIFTLLENSIVKTTMHGEIPQRQGNIDPSIAPFDIFPVTDGYIALGVGNDKLFRIFCEVIGRPELADDPLYLTNDLRCQNYEKGLRQIIADWSSTRTKKELEDVFDQAGIPCGPVLDMKEAIDHPHFQAREMMVHIDHPTIGDMYIQGCPIKLSATPGGVDTPAPLLGQHNQEVFGYSLEELKDLHAEGVL